MLLQDKDDTKNYLNTFGQEGNITDTYFLRANDYLFINVSTPDPKISEFFNQGQMGGSGNQQNQTFFYYQIDDTMNIDFPYVGKINLTGCNVKLAKGRIQDALKPFLKEYSLTVKLASNTFTTMGEFGKQGVHNMQEEQVTIFEAIALAGGIKAYGKSKEVQLVRQTPEGPVTYIIDITDKNIVNSVYYHIYPNDFLYVRPMKAKQWGIGESFSLGMISAVLALYLTINSVK